MLKTLRREMEDIQSKIKLLEMKITMFEIKKVHVMQST